MRRCRHTLINEAAKRQLAPPTHPTLSVSPSPLVSLTVSPSVAPVAPPPSRLAHDSLGSAQVEEALNVTGGGWGWV